TKSRVDLDKLDPTTAYRRGYDEPASGKQLEGAVPTARPLSGEDFDERLVFLGSAVEQCGMNPGSESADVFGVDGAGAFAEAQAVAEDLCAADAGFVDEAAEGVEA